MKRNRHHTGWAGVLATAAELTRRGYDVTLTFGNTPRTDLLVATPEGPSFSLQVKSASSPNWIPIQKTLLESTPRNELIFVVVRVPSDQNGHFQFFVLTHEEIQSAWRQIPKTTRDGKPLKPGWEGIGWGTVTPHENAWHKIPGWSTPRQTRAG